MASHFTKIIFILDQKFIIFTFPLHKTRIYFADIIFRFSLIIVDYVYILVHIRINIKL